MATCPYCEGEISDTAVKCKHCGEWVRPPPASGVAGGPVPVRPPSAGPRDAGDDDALGPSLGRAANRYVSFQMMMGVIGAVIFLIILFTVFLPISRLFTNSFSPQPGPPTLPNGIELP